jgi:hypothetical protein
VLPRGISTVRGWCPLVTRADALVRANVVSPAAARALAATMTVARRSRGRVGRPLAGAATASSAMLALLVLENQL